MDEPGQRAGQDTPATLDFEARPRRSRSSPYGYIERLFVGAGTRVMLSGDQTRAFSYSIDTPPRAVRPVTPQQGLLPRL